MNERQKRPIMEFGKPRTKQGKPAGFFTEGEDLPLFSGTPQQAIDHPYIPEDQTYKQQVLPEMPGIDYDVVRENDRKRKRKRAGKQASGSPGLLLGAAELAGHDD